MKKVLLFVLSMVLVAAISIGATLAYLQDSDSDVNVMTMGNVYIEQHEYEREVDADGNYITYTETKRDGAPTGYKLAPFTQAKPLYPAVGTAANYDETKVYFAQLDGNPMGAQAPFDERELKNAQDKFVFVENTGKTDAYVRTIIAFEIGTAENVMGEPNNANENLIMMNYNQYWTRNFIGTAKIDGNNYYIVEFVYDGANGTNGKHPDGIVHPGEFTYCSLAQVYMTPKATNEDVEKIDGNKNGTYDILVLSQAVQAAGFSDAKTALDTAFGAITVENHPWSEKTEVIPGLLWVHEDYVAEKGTDGSYIFAQDFDADDLIFFGSGTNVELDLNDKTVTAMNKNQYLFGAQSGGTLHLTGEGTVNMGMGFYSNKEGASIIIDGGTYNATVTKSYDTSSRTINCHSAAQKGGKIVINGGTFTSNVDNATLFYLMYGSEMEINGGFFENTADKTPDLLIANRYEEHDNRITITGGTFVNYDPSLEADQREIIPDGYKVISETQANGDVWYTVVAE